MLIYREDVYRFLQLGITLLGIVDTVVELFYKKKKNMGHIQEEKNTLFDHVKSSETYKLMCKQLISSTREDLI